jgi:hypothetical protein
MCPVVVEYILGQVDRHAGRVLFSDGRDEDVIPIEELKGVVERVGIVGVLKEERIEEWQAGYGLSVQMCVDVVKQTVAYGDEIAGCLGN